jgi:hypothetical protein
MVLTLLALGIFNVEDTDSAGLVMETDRSLFSEGLAKYYSHIVGLFERAKAYSYVAEYARLGLGAIRGRGRQGLEDRTSSAIVYRCDTNVEV